MAIGDAAIDNPTDINELREFFLKSAGQGVGHASLEGDVLAVFNPSYQIVRDGSDRVIRIDVTFNGKTARKTFSYPDAVTTNISAWTMV